MKKHECRIQNTGIRRCFTRFMFIMVFVLSGSIQPVAFSQQGVIHSFPVDILAHNTPFVLSEVQATTPEIHADIRVGGIPYKIPGGVWYGVLYIVGQTAITNSDQGSTWLAFTPSTNQLATPGTFSSQLILYGSGGAVQEWDRGTITVSTNPVANLTPFPWSQP